MRSVPRHVVRLTTPPYPPSLLLQLSGGKKPIMYCEAGGTLNASSNFPFGKASRSLRAVFQVSLHASYCLTQGAGSGRWAQRLTCCMHGSNPPNSTTAVSLTQHVRHLQVLASKTADASSVAHLDGGIYGWDAEDLPVDGEYDGSNAGRTPAAAEPAQFPNRG